MAASTRGLRRQGVSIIVVGNDTRRRRQGNASVFGKSDCYGNEIATLRSQ